MRNRIAANMGRKWCGCLRRRDANRNREHWMVRPLRAATDWCATFGKSGHRFKVDSLPAIRFTTIPNREGCCGPHVDQSVTNKKGQPDGWPSSFANCLVFILWRLLFLGRFLLPLRRGSALTLRSRGPRFGTSIVLLFSRRRGRPRLGMARARLGAGIRSTSWLLRNRARRLLRRSGVCRTCLRRLNWPRRLLHLRTGLGAIVLRPVLRRLSLTRCLLSRRVVLRTIVIRPRLRCFYRPRRLCLLRRILRTIVLRTCSRILTLRLLRALVLWTLILRTGGRRPWHIAIVILRRAGTRRVLRTIWSYSVRRSTRTRCIFILLWRRCSGTRSRATIFGSIRLSTGSSR